MNTDATIQLEDAVQLPTYAKMPIALARGEGCTVWDAEGNAYLDFYGGHCVALLGHCPPPVVQAIQQQAAELIFYSNAVYSPIRAAAAKALTDLAPEGLGHVFFCNSGAEANETALKLARTTSGKPGVLAMEGGFHGRTLGSLAATHNPKYRAPYAAVLPKTRFVPFGNLEAVEAVLTKNSNIGALIIEPIQSMAGVTEAPPSYFQGLRALCDKHDVKLIFDEVQTGVGRTGTFSICDQLGMKPDLISLAKSLGSGVPIGAVLASDAIATTVKNGDQGSTFGGGMLAMAALKATLDTIVADNLMDRAPAIFETIAEAVGPFVKGIRGKGCLIGLELDGPAKPVLSALRERGVLAGSSGNPNVIRLMPPINTPDEAIAQFADAFEAVMTAQLAES